MSDYIPTEANSYTLWPLEPDGPLPPSLFPDPYLEGIFFQAGPEQWGCTPAVIRRALKSLVKKPVGSSGQQPWNKLKDPNRDRALVSYICNNSRTRSLIKRIELIRESTNGRSVKSLTGFTETVWHNGYTRSPDEELVILSKWAMSTAKRKAGGNEEAFYLTADIIDAALPTYKGNVPVDSIEFARMLVLFSSLLDTQESLDLLRSGLSHGCTYIQPLLPTNAIFVPTHDDHEVSELHSILPGPNPTSLPRFDESPLNLNVSAPSTDPQAVQLTDNVTLQQENLHTAINDVGGLKDISVLELAMLPAREYLDASSSISSLHSQFALLEQANLLRSEYIRTSIATITDRLGCEVLLDETSDTLILDIGIALPSVMLLQPNNHYFKDWLDQVGTPVPITRLRDLASVQSCDDDYQRAISLFSNSVFAALRVANAEEINGWIIDLSVAEYSQLFLAVDCKTNPITASLLIAFGIERHGSAFARTVLAKIATITEQDILRSLLRFLDTSSLAIGEVPELARILVREQIYDLFASDSLGGVVDLGATAFDPSLVGHNVSAAIQAIMSGLPITDSLTKLRSIVAATERMPTGTASTHAVEFIEAPVGLNGHFKKLREKARDTVFMPLIQNGRLNTRLASDVVREIENGNHEHHVWKSIEDTLPAGGRLESQHRTQLKRYLENGRKLLEAAIRASGEMSKANETWLGVELGKLIRQMQPTGKVGSEAWLENEFQLLFSGDKPSPATTELANSYYSFDERPWSVNDSQWATRYICLPEFYEGSVLSAHSILLKLLATYSLTALEASSIAFAKLIDRGLYRAAYDLTEDQTDLGYQIQECRKQLELAFKPIANEINSDLTRIRDEYGEDVIQATNSFTRISQALKRFDKIDAVEHLAMLEIELLDAKQRAERDNELALQAIESSDILARLLRAGAADIQLDTPLTELRKIWEQVLTDRKPERQHLIALYSIATSLQIDLQEFPTLQEAIILIESQLKEPEAWLSAKISESLTDFLAASTQKLRSWAQAASILDANTRRSLSTLIVAFFAFVQEQSDAAKAAHDPTAIDDILEQAIELDSVIVDGLDPSACLAAASELLGLRFDPAHDELPEPSFSKPGSIRQTADGFAIAVASAVAAKAWAELKALGTSARGSAADDEIARIDEVVDFSQAMLADAGGVSQEAYDLLDGATRAVVSAGHPVHRALSSRDRLNISLEFLITALGHEAPRQLKTDLPTRWACLVTGWPTLFRTAGEGDKFPQTSRVLEYVFSSSLAFDASDLLWTASSSLPEPANTRSDLLRYLHDLRQNEVISRLCGRYDRGAQLKVEQMLGLRNAAASRPDLIPAVEALAVQALAAAKSAATRNFIRSLPTAVSTVEGRLSVTVQDDILVRDIAGIATNIIQIPVSVSAHGVVPTRIQAHLIKEDDVSFSDNNGRLLTLSEELLYVPRDFIINVRLGSTWMERLRSGEDSSIRLRFAAVTITDAIVSADVVCSLNAPTEGQGGGPRIDRDTLLEYYPGVGNTPAEGKNFIGRHSDLEQLTSFLVAANHPSPILLTGMRRVGKTSLLYAFHARYTRPGDSHVQTVYLSIAEKRNAFMLADKTVSAGFFDAITRALGKPYFPEDDQNRLIGERLREVVGSDRNAVRSQLEACYDPESLADSLMHLSEKVIGWLGKPSMRLVFLVDEAESFVVPYNHGGTKKLELEQLLQSLREVSQTSNRVGIVLSGSNHIKTFAREYKNAFFGSCVRMDLKGITDYKEASLLLYPARVSAFVRIEASAVSQGVELCAGMPQFMWQLGAATTWGVRGGSAVRADVRSAMNALIAGGRDDLPFQPYDVLEPIEHMLKLQGDREQNLLWLLLRRVATNSSLATVDAPRHFLVDQPLLDLDNREMWNKRLATLIDLDILIPVGNSSVRFAVPLFAEAFRSSRMEHEHAIRHQRVAA